MGGNWRTRDWNIAHNPVAWEMMFNAVPINNVGLEWGQVTSQQLQYSSCNLPHRLLTWHPLLCYDKQTSSSIRIRYFLGLSQIK